MKMCYGALFKTSDLAEKLGLEAFAATVKQCSFCKKMVLEKDANFCSNCGSKLKRELGDICETEIIEVLLRLVAAKGAVHMKDQLKISFIHTNGSIAICKVLDDDSSIVLFDRALQYFSWIPVDKAIQDFLRTIDICPDAKIRMFCMIESQKGTKT